MSTLFTPYTIRGLTLKNRIVMSPMCMYTAGTDGKATDWHLVHLGARAVGGAGLIITEATAVQSGGRISEADLGLWEDGQIGPLRRIADLIHAQGVPFGVQLAHAGRKAWSGSKGQGPETPVAPSALPFGEGWVRPDALDQAGIDGIIESFRLAARRALQAGLDVIELHAAHGYLLHEFLSPLSNQRSDAYGGSPENRMRLVLQVTEAVRSEWPGDKPLFLRVSASDWTEGGLVPADLVPLAKAAQPLGVDLIDCSSGGVVPVRPPDGPGYQVPFAAEIRARSGVPTGAVGRITEPEQAETILRTGQADLIILGRALLRDPYWPLRAARTLGDEIDWPVQYLRAKV